MVLKTMYEYTAISGPRTIRLIHLHPGVGTDPINLSLVTASLDTEPAFETISYCWGDATDQREIICNDSVLFITNSLFTGLAQFRHSDESRVLWADAICINQADVVEKSRQVLLMADIYSQATRVLIWLGIADDPMYGLVPSDVGLSIRRALQLLPDFDPENAVDINAKITKLRSDSQRLHEEGRPNVLDHDWRPLVALLSRPWFHRKWVVQEVSVARHAVLCAGGDVEVPWSELAQLAFKFELMGVEQFVRFDLERKDKEAENTRHHHKDQQGLASSSDIRPGKFSLLNPISRSMNCVVVILMIQTYRHRGTILDGVVATKYFRCTDPRDHVYSLLSLGAIGPTVQPDYESSLANVFHRFSIAMLVEGQSLKSLSLAPEKRQLLDPNPQRLEGLPSWVPDLRIMRNDVLISYTVRPQAFFAGGYSKPVLSISEDQRILSCEGRVFDSIKKVSASFMEMILNDIPEVKISWEVSELFPSRRRMHLAKWLESCYETAFGCSYHAEGLASNSLESTMAFSRTMVCGIDQMRNRLSPELVSAFPGHMEWAVSHASNKDGISRQDATTSSMFSDTIEQSLLALSSFEFCVTENGRFGRVPPTAQTGDCICVLRGGEVPFVLRPTGHATYTLIGECYIDGVMDGEALGEEPTPILPLETIRFE